MGKAKKKITNWAAYNKALCKRGSVTFWIDDSAVDAWQCKIHHGKRGRGFQYSDTAIETTLMIKGIFSLPLRALQGFIDSIFELLKVPLRHLTTRVSANARRQFRSNIVTNPEELFAISLLTRLVSKSLAKVSGR